MGLFDSFIEKRASATTIAKLSQTGEYWNWLGGSNTPSGANVTRDTAMRVGMAATCIQMISNSVAQMPLKLKQSAGGKTEDATWHPLYTLLKLQPNSEMSAFVWRRAAQANILSEGNAYFYIERDKLSYPRNLWPLPAGSCIPIEIKDNRNTKRLKTRYGYRIQLTDTPFIAKKEEILHISNFNFNGLRGESVITNFARDMIGNGISLQEFEGNFFKNGMHFAGALEHPETLGANKESFIQALRKRYSGGSNTGTPLVLEQGMKYNHFKVSLVDQQFIEMMDLNDLQIARIFLMPPSRVGIEGVNESNNSLENENKRYLDTTIMPHIVNWEEQLNIKLLDEDERKKGYGFKFNFDSLLRPDAKTRAEIDRIQWEHGVPLNVLREREDLNPIPGGDTSFVPMNFIPVEQAGLEPKQEQKNFREIRSIKSRDAVGRAWKTVVKQAIDRVVRRESNQVSRVVQQDKRAKADSFNEWLDEWYGEFKGMIVSEVGGAFRGFMIALHAEIQKEVGSNPVTDAELDKMIRDFTEGFASIWVYSSIGQIRQIMNEYEDYVEEVVKRTEEWKETRTEKRTVDTVAAAPNSMAYFLFGAAGVSSTWRIRGAFTCDYCKTLEGKKISPRGAFIQAGETVTVEGKTPMKVRGLTKYPPLHGGCDCYISAG